MYSLRPMRVSLATVLRTAGALPGLLKAVLAIQYSPVDKFKVHHCVAYAHTLLFAFCFKRATSGSTAKSL